MLMSQVIDSASRFSCCHLYVVHFPFPVKKIRKKERRGNRKGEREKEKMRKANSSGKYDSMRV